MGTAFRYDDTLRSFGFKATPRAATRLRDELAKGAVNVHVDIDTTFHRGRIARSLVEIPGRVHPDQRIVLAAHVQEPGANDNASGCGTLLAAALAMHDAIRRGALPAPARTITFLWVDEIRGSEQWLKDHADLVKGVVAMLSLDMTGEDTTKTGGTFLIEKQPDPSAIWERPSDPHSEWGASKVDPATVRGSFLNDLHLAVALRRARDTSWIVRTNPYEGGSDHTVFMRAGVPALLNWHFTDRYYHTNLDTIDKVSARRDAARRDHRRHDRAVPGVGRQDRRGGDDEVDGNGAGCAARDRTEEQRHAGDPPGVAQVVRRSDRERSARLAAI